MLRPICWFQVDTFRRIKLSTRVIGKSNSFCTAAWLQPTFTLAPADAERYAEREAMWSEPGGLVYSNNWRQIRNMCNQHSGTSTKEQPEVG